MHDDKRYGWPTTRCFPRTMDDAFKHLGCDPEWFYPPEKNHTWGGAVMWIAGFMMWVALAYYFAKN